MAAVSPVFLCCVSFLLGNCPRNEVTGKCVCWYCLASGCSQDASIESFMFGVMWVLCHSAAYIAAMFWSEI